MRKTSEEAESLIFIGNCQMLRFGSQSRIETFENFMKKDTSRVGFNLVSIRKKKKNFLPISADSFSQRTESFETLIQIIPKIRYPVLHVLGTIVIKSRAPVILRSARI